VVPEGVEQLFGNRDPNKTAADRKSAGRTDAPKESDSPKGLSQLVGRKWDGVLDTSGYFPRMVKASAELLAPNVRQYIFISSISVYKDTSQPNYDETAELATLADPTTEEMGKNFENFGGGKALCERGAESAMPGRVTNVRPGFIVGPRDTSGRFIYWPVRASLGGEMLVPGTPNDPIQIIDVRDLADWLMHCLENNIVGVYNATGPAKELTMKTLLEGVCTGVGSKTATTWVDYEWLKTQGIREGQFPFTSRLPVRRPVFIGATFRGASHGPHLPPRCGHRPRHLRVVSIASARNSNADCPSICQARREGDWLAREKNLLEKFKARTKK